MILVLIKIKYNLLIFRSPDKNNDAGKLIKSFIYKILNINIEQNIEKKILAKKEYIKKDDITLLGLGKEIDNANYKIKWFDYKDIDNSDILNISIKINQSDTDYYIVSGTKDNQTYTLTLYNDEIIWTTKNKFDREEDTDFNKYKKLFIENEITTKNSTIKVAEELQMIL